MSLSSNRPGRIASYLAVLRYRDFRLLCASSVFDALGFMGENVVLGWTVLTITDSPLMVGLGLGLRSAPAFFLGLFAGAITDAVDRRRLMRLLDVGSAVIAVAIAFLLISDRAQLWQIFTLTVFSGVIGTIYQTARASFAYDVVGPTNVLSGLAYVSMAMRLGGAAGALIAGLVLSQFGPGPGYLVLAGGYMASASILLAVRSPGQAAPRHTQPILRNLKEFFSELRVNDSLLTLVFIVGLVEVLGFSTQALMPSLARDVLGVGAAGLGVMGALASGGGFGALVLISLFGPVPRQGLAFMLTLFVFGGSLLILGFATTFFVALLGILIMSGMMALSDLFTQSLAQRVVPNALRGRAMGAWMVAVGTAPVGNLQIGALASAFGVTVALASHGIGLIALGALALLTFRKLRRL